MIEVNYSKEILERNVKEGYLTNIVKKRILTSHFSLSNAKLFLSKLDLSSVKEIMLIHLSDANINLRDAVKEIKELTGKPTKALM